MATGNEHDPASTDGWIAGSSPSDEPSPRAVPPFPLGAGPNESSSLRSRLTLAVAVAGSVLLLGATVLFWRHQGSVSGPPSVAVPEPWQAPTVPGGSDAPTELPPISAGVPVPTVGGPDPGSGPGGDGDGDGEPPATTAPTTGAPPPATTQPTTSPPGGDRNLSLDADSDGSSKATDTRFGDVQDGDLSTFWSPKGTTGEISIKWDSPVTLGRINIREASGGGAIRNWRVVDYDTDRVLATGTGAGVITFSPVTLHKITFVILSAAGVPRVAEFETFAP